VAETKKKEAKESEETVAIATYEKRKPGRNVLKDDQKVGNRRPNTPDTDSKKDAKTESNPRTSARLESKRPVTPGAEARRPSTPSKKVTKEDDPYDFKEIEESTLKFEPTIKTVESPTRGATNTRGSDKQDKDDKQSKTATRMNSPSAAKGGVVSEPAKFPSISSPSKSDVPKPGVGKNTSVTTSDVKSSTVTSNQNKNTTQRGRKKRTEEVSGSEATDTTKSDNEAKTNSETKTKKDANANKDKDAKQDTDSKLNKSPESFSTMTKATSPGQPMVALQRLPTSATVGVVGPISTTPLIRPMPNPPNRFALFPHLASLSAGGGTNRPLPTVAPPLPPSTIMPLPTIAPSLPPSAPPLPPIAKFLTPPLNITVSTSGSSSSIASSNISTFTSTCTTLSTLSALTTTTSTLFSTTLSSEVSHKLPSSVNPTIASFCKSPTSPSLSTTSALMSAGISVNPSTPLSTASVIDAIVGNVLQTNLAIKKEDDVKPTIPLPSSVCPNLNPKSPRTEPVKSETKKLAVKTEVKQETEESELEQTKANKNNSDSDDASANQNKPSQPITSDAPTSTLSPRKTRKKLKLRGPRNYNLKSRELVSDTDSESSEAESKRSLPPKRRKTIEKTAKKAEVAKKADESDIEKSLVCRETIERSPERESSDKFSVAGTAASKNTDSSDLDSITGSPKRNASDLESVTTRTRGGVGSDVDSIHDSVTGDSVHDSVTGSSRRAGSVDSRGGMDSSSDTRSGRQGKRKRGGGNGATSEDISPIDAKKKRKSRDSVGRGRGKGRGRVSGSARIPPRDEEVGSEASNLTSTSIMGTRSKTDFEMTKLERLDNAELEALAQPKQNANSKYNFYVKLDSTMDSGSRISALQSSLEDLRKTYLNIKTELTALERRRKKIRKKKEQRNNTNEISTPS